MRTKRTAMTLATIVSSLLLATAIVLGVRSFFRQDLIAHGRLANGGQIVRGAYTLNGSMTWIRMDVAKPSPGLGVGWNAVSKPNRLATWRMGGFLGFWSDAYTSSDASGTSVRVSQWQVPLWPVASLAAILPTWRLIASRRARRKGRIGFDVVSPTAGVA